MFPIHSPPENCIDTTRSLNSVFDGSRRLLDVLISVRGGWEDARGGTKTEQRGGRSNLQTDGWESIEEEQADFLYK